MNTFNFTYFGNPLIDLLLTFTSENKTKIRFERDW